MARRKIEGEESQDPVIEMAEQPEVLGDIQLIPSPVPPAPKEGRISPQPILATPVESFLLKAGISRCSQCGDKLAKNAQNQLGCPISNPECPLIKAKEKK